MFSPLRARKPIREETGRGEFVCPNCREKTPYRQIEVIRRKSYLFVAFKGETLETYIECQKCMRHMSVEDLRGRMTEDTKQILEGVKTKLESGESIEEILSRLIQAGMSERDAHQTVNTCVGITSKKCPQCSLRFLASVHSCKKCGHMLP
jgi:hypothetical protein